jgi:hypothetical protein
MDYAKRLLFAVGVLAAAAANGASAQPAVSLTGNYRCVQGCVPGLEDKPAFVTQNGWDLNLVTEAGVPIRAWFDWYAPANRIWMETLQQGAVYSPDGMTIQFDRGTVWLRHTEPDPVVVADCARRYRSYDPLAQTYLGRDGRRHSCP